MLSQFLHGEQGALLAAAQLVDAGAGHGREVLRVDAGLSTRARHVEVYDRYLHEKIGFSYPISPYLKKLLDLILTDSRWDMKFLGMQIMVEGLALAAFGMIRAADHGAAAQEAHALRDARRGAPRRLRRAVAARLTTTT